MGKKVVGTNPAEIDEAPKRVKVSQADIRAYSLDEALRVPRAIVRKLQLKTSNSSQTGCRHEDESQCWPVQNDYWRCYRILRRRSIVIRCECEGDFDRTQKRAGPKTVARQKERKQKSPSKGSAETKLKLARILKQP